jgi:CheY-like chemotaxis protein
MMKRKHVLVIDDDAGVQRLLQMILEPAGYAVTAIDSALGAMTTVRRLQPDVILLDLALPYRSGASLLDELKADAATADVPVLVVSANTHVLPTERRALAVDIIAKPFDAEGLLAAVEAAGAPHSGPRPLREVRVEHLLSIRELARAAGVAPSPIYLIEAGRTTPQLSIIRKIAGALGVEPREISEFRQAIDARQVHW